MSTRIIPYHFNPRMNNNMIVRNSYNLGQWGEAEERLIYTRRSYPFQRGKCFEVSFKLLDFVKLGRYIGYAYVAGGSDNRRKQVRDLYQRRLLFRFPTLQCQYTGHQISGNYRKH